MEKWAVRGLCTRRCNPEEEELRGVVGRPPWEVLLGQLPAALLGLLGFHSSIILIFPPLKTVFHQIEMCSLCLSPRAVPGLSELGCIFWHPLIRTKKAGGGLAVRPPLAIPLSPSSP